MIGAPLPDFCKRCGLAEEHPVHHGHDDLWGWSEKIKAHKFEAAKPNGK
jgi:hypothetical protein